MSNTLSIKMVSEKSSFEIAPSKLNPNSVNIIHSLSVSDFPLMSEIIDLICERYNTILEPYYQKVFLNNLACLKYLDGLDQSLQIKYRAIHDPTRGRIFSPSSKLANDLSLEKIKWNLELLACYISVHFNPIMQNLKPLERYQFSS